MKAPRVTVVGSNMVDLITYVDRMPSRGETIEAPEFSMGFGGKGANQAVAAALLGGDVAMVTKVGDDLFGPNTKANLEHYGIDTRFVEAVENVSSGVAPIFVEPDSSNSILIVKGANSYLEPADIDRARDQILGSDLVVMQLEVQLSTVYYTIELCSAHGVPVLLNPAPADPKLELERIIGVGFFAPNETELATLTGKPVDTIEQAKDAAQGIVDAGIPRVVVTLGEQGSLYVTPDTQHVVPPVRVESKDSTGAGDAFIGCFAVNYVRTQAIEESLELANAYAALSTTRPGTQKSFATAEEFEAFRRENK
ncbi:MAG: ribokinase [Spirochaetia bacterium]